MKDDSDYRSLTPKDGWLKKSCERCNGDFWLAPGQFNNIRFCKDSCRHEPPEVRFWKSVTKGENPDDCWTTSFTPKGKYPTFKVNGIQMRCSRFVLELTLGRPLLPGMYALHSCDNTKCVNPSHLREGTDQDNSDDRVKRKRSPLGEKHPNAELTEIEVREIKQLKGKMTLKQVAEKFSKSIHTIWCIWKGRTWRDV